MQKTKKVQVIGVNSKIITAGTDLFGAVKLALKKSPPFEKDVLVIASKVLAVTQSRVKKIRSERDFEKLVYEEADRIIGHSIVTLTEKNGIFIPWAGIDRSNIRKGYAVLWPDKPFEGAEALCGKLKKHYRLKKFGVIISDSHCIPLRRGIVGLALGYAGFKGVRDLRGRKDIYGNELKVSQQNMADMIATAAHLVTGEADEKMPFALVRGAEVDFTSKKINPQEILIKKNEDLFNPLY